MVATHEPWSDEDLTRGGGADLAAAVADPPDASDEAARPDVTLVAAERQEEDPREGEGDESPTADAAEPREPREPQGIGGMVPRIMRRVNDVQQGHRPLAFVYGVVKKFGDDQAGNLAALVAYYLFFSIFPLLLVFTTVLGFVLADDPSRQQALLDSALANFPVLGDQIRTNIGSARGSGVALVIGLVGALWGGMGAVSAMQNAMNSIWDVPRREWPNLVQQRVRSLVMLVGFAVFVGLSTVAGGVASAAGSWPLVGRVVVLVPALVLNALLFLGSFRVLVNTKLTWSQLWPGAIVAGVFFTIIQTVGGVYANHVVQNAGPVYGSFAIVLGLLSLLYMQAQLTVLAAEVNVVRAHGLYPRSLVADRPTAADNESLARYAGMEARRPDQAISISLDAPAPDTATDEAANATTPAGAPVGARAATSRLGN